MHNEGKQVHVSEEEASGGSKEGVVRWVLIIGTLLAIGALSLIWITGALVSTNPDADNVSVGAKMAAEQEQAADAAAPAAPTAAAETSDREVQNGVPVVNN